MINTNDLSLLTTLHPDIGGAGQGSGATCIPSSINVLNFCKCKNHLHLLGELLLAELQLFRINNKSIMYAVEPSNEHSCQKNHHYDLSKWHNDTYRAQYRHRLIFSRYLGFTDLWYV